MHKTKTLTESQKFWAQFGEPIALHATKKVLLIMKAQLLEVQILISFFLKKNVWPDNATM